MAALSIELCKSGNQNRRLQWSYVERSLPIRRIIAAHVRKQQRQRNVIASSLEWRRAFGRFQRRSVLGLVCRRQADRCLPVRRPPVAARIPDWETSLQSCGLGELYQGFT